MGYYLNFVEEGIMNPDYANYVAGRIEVCDDSQPYAIVEIRFFTDRAEEFFQYRYEMDWEEVTPQEIEEIKAFVKENFYINKKTKQ